MDEDNLTEPADVDNMTSDDIMTMGIQFADLISSSESEDDKLEHTTHVMEREETLPRLERHMEDIIGACNDQQFKLNFRISRSTFDYIFGIVTPKLELLHPVTILPEKQILMTLLFLTTSDSNRSIGERFNVGPDCVIRCTNRVVYALYDLAPSIITWPSGNNVSEIWNGFKDISDFPNVIGVLGSTHIKILPWGHPDVFFKNSTKQWCIHLQLVCDHNARFIYCFAKCPGSMSCQGLFEFSELQKWLGDPEKFPADCYILGGATHKLHENVIVPYHDDGHLTPKQQNFNVCHSAARIAIKKACSLLMTRFCNMRYGFKMQKVDVISIFTIACCVIHNICVSENDEIDYELFDEAEKKIRFRRDTASPKAQDKRDSICEMLPMRHI